MSVTSRKAETALSRQQGNTNYLTLKQKAVGDVRERRFSRHTAYVYGKMYFRVR